jgi:transposase
LPIVVSGKEATIMSRKHKQYKAPHRSSLAGRGQRYELTDEAFDRIEPLLPKQKPGGQWKEHRTVLNGMFWILNTGAQWRDMPQRYGKWKTVYDRYRRWTREGLFDRILNRLHLELDADGRIDWDVFDVDGSNIRAHQSAAGAATNTSKKRAKQSPTTTPWDDRAEALVRSFIF